MDLEAIEFYGSARPRQSYESVERRLEQLENRLHSRKLRDVRDVTELSSVELALYLLDEFSLLDARKLVDSRRYILSHEPTVPM